MPVFTEITMKNILTEEETNQMIQDYVNDGCTTTKKKETDGTWTVIATYPEKKIKCH